MKLSIDKRKYRRTSIISWASSILFLIVAILVPIMNIQNPEKEWYQIVLVMLGLLFISCVSFWPYYHLYRNREYFDEMISVLDDLLIIRTSILKKKQVVPIKSLTSIAYIQKSRNLGEIVLWTNKIDPNGNPIINQFNGGKVHLTDYFVNTEEFRELALFIELEIAKSKKSSQH